MAPLFAHGSGNYPASDILFNAAAAVAAPAAVEFGVKDACGLILVINAGTGTDAGTTLTVTVKGVVYVGGAKGAGGTAVKWTILASAAIATTGVTVLQIAPGIADVANLAKGHLLPELVEVSVAHGNSDAITYTVSGILTP